MATESAAAPRRLWQLPAFVLGLVAVWAAATYVTPPPDASAKLSSKLDDLSAALERKPFNGSEVEPLVKALAESPSPTPQSHFVLGSAYVALASQKPTESPDLWKLALQHFEICDGNALKPDDIARMAFRSAKANAAVNRGEPASLIAALMNSPAGEDRSECPRLIAECALRMPKPDLARARDELTNYLGGQHKASPAVAERYKLKLADLNAKLGEAERSRRWLKDISASAPADVLASAKVTLAKQAVAEKNWAEAVTLLEAALAVPSISAAEKNTIRYQLGDALTKMGNTPQALPWFELASRDAGPLGGQASLRIGELRGLDPSGAGKRGDAVEWLERASAMLDDSTKRDALPVFANVIAICLAEADYASAARAVQAKARISGQGEVELQADVNTAWGVALKKAGDPKAGEKLKSAAEGYRSLNTTAALRKALPLFRAAGDSKAALETAEALLNKTDLDPASLAAVSLERAELLPATDFNSIKTSLETALGQPGPGAMAARLKLAMLYINRGQELLAGAQGSQHPDATKKEAEQTSQFGRDLLKQVADAATVAPESRVVHEQALFELGRLNLRDAKFTEAEARFKKQLNLYATGSYAGYGRLWLVCSLLQQARGSENKKLLEEALGYLKPLTQSNDAYLRTYGEIWTANTLLELGDAAAVVPLAKDLVTKYAGKPEELVAGKLLFYAYLKLPTPDAVEAARTLDRMDAAFGTLVPAAYPSDPEYSREKWKTELPRLRTELRKFAP